MPPSPARPRHLTHAQQAEVLSTDQIRSCLERFEYKPGWSVSVFDDAFEGQKIRIVAEGLQDSYNPGQTIDLGVNSFLAPVMDEWDLKRWLYWRISRIELHELREFLKWDGHLVWDPHAPEKE